MAASDEEIQSALEDAAIDAVAGPKRWRNGRMEVERHSPKELLEALALARGLNSSRRGFRLAQIDNAQ